MIGNIIQPNGESSGGGSEYNTTETLVGKWKGSNMYAKIISGTLSSVTESGTEYARYEASVAITKDKIVMISPIYLNKPNTSSACSIITSSGSVYIWDNWINITASPGWAGGTATVIVYYTK